MYKFLSLITLLLSLTVTHAQWNAMTSSLSTQQWVHIAQCRLQCVQQLLDPSESPETSCANNTNGCFVCWELCERMGSDFPQECDVKEEVAAVLIPCKFFTRLQNSASTETDQDSKPLQHGVTQLERSRDTVIVTSPQLAGARHVTMVLYRARESSDWSYHSTSIAERVVLSTQYRDLSYYPDLLLRVLTLTSQGLYSDDVIRVLTAVVDGTQPTSTYAESSEQPSTYPTSNHIGTSDATSGNTTAQTTALTNTARHPTQSIKHEYSALSIVLLIVIGSILLTLSLLACHALHSNTRVTKRMRRRARALRHRLRHQHGGHVITRAPVYTGSVMNLRAQSTSSVTQLSTSQQYPCPTTQGPHDTLTFSTASSGVKVIASQSASSTPVPGYSLHSEQQCVPDQQCVTELQCVTEQECVTDHQDFTGQQCVVDINTAVPCVSTPRSEPTNIPYLHNTPVDTLDTSITSSNTSLQCMDGEPKARLRLDIMFDPKDSTPIKKVNNDVLLDRTFRDFTPVRFAKVKKIDMNANEMSMTEITHHCVSPDYRVLDIAASPTDQEEPMFNVSSMFYEEETQGEVLLKTEHDAAFHAKTALKAHSSEHEINLDDSYDVTSDVTPLSDDVTPLSDDVVHSCNTSFHFADVSNETSDDVGVCEAEGLWTLCTALVTGERISDLL